MIKQTPHETTDEGTMKNCNRGTSLDRSVGKLLMVDDEGLNQFYWLETPPLILLQL